jgi:hypothetical protein
MREGFDKEIDSLLRRTARAPVGARGNGASASKPDTHLDADELAAFAEGALPEAARMNAVSHLADCGECRSLAVNLTRAAGVEVELEKRAVAAAASSPSRASESKPSRGWLAALFAPRSLRYVAPALAVCLVAAVSFIALRSRSGSGLVSLQDRNAGASPSIATTEANSQQLYDGQPTANANANTNTATTTTGKEEAARGDKGAPELATAQPYKKDAEADAPDGSTPSGHAESKAAGEDAAAQPSQPAKEVEDAPAAAGPPAPTEVAKSTPAENLPASKYGGENMKAAPPPPARQTDEVASNEPKQQQRGAQGNYESQAPDGSRARSRAGSNNAQGVGGLAATRDNRDSDARRENSAPSRRGGSSQDERLDDGRANAVEESRSVAGHRFRREGGAWVDVNYKRSMSSTGVRRGTDAYRALVADIPEIGRVAEQLGGVVTVVVRGRAYHIR